jgi:hypothetical protein
VASGNIAAFCRPPQGGSVTAVHEEGIGGIENAFGHIVLPLLQPMDPSTCNSTCCSIPQPFTVLMSLQQLGAGASYDPLSARVASGTDLDGDAGICGIAVPRFDGTDVWSMVQGTTEPLPASYLVNDTWVSGPIAKLSVMYQGLGLQPAPAIMLDIVHARITMKLDPTHETATAGVISGVLPTADLEQRVVALAGAISTRDARPDADLRRDLDRAGFHGHHRSARLDDARHDRARPLCWRRQRRMSGGARPSRHAWASVVMRTSAVTPLATHSTVSSWNARR